MALLGHCRMTCELREQRLHYGRLASLKLSNAINEPQRIRETARSQQLQRQSVLGLSQHRIITHTLGQVNRDVQQHGLGVSLLLAPPLPNGHAHKVDRGVDEPEAA